MINESGVVTTTDVFDMGLFLMNTIEKWVACADSYSIFIYPLSIFKEICDDNVTDYKK